MNSLQTLTNKFNALYLRAYDTENPALTREAMLIARQIINVLSYDNNLVDDILPKLMKE